MYNLQDWRTYDEFTEKYGIETGTPDNSAKLFQIIECYNTIGVLVRENLIDSKLIYKHNPHNLILTWNRLEPYIKGLRENFDVPNYAHNFEYLANLMKDMRKMEESEQS